MNQRIEYIDTLKGIAIILVVMGHVIQFLWGDRYGSDNVLFVIIYSFHMPLFFFLSGFCTKVVDQNGGISLKKKMKTLFYPFLLWNLIVYAQHIQVEPGSIRLIRHAGYWFLICLFYMNCTSKMAQLFEVRINKDGKLLVDIIIHVILYLIVLFICKYSEGSKIFELLCLQFMPFNMPFFILGYLFKKHKALEDFCSTEKAGFYAFLAYCCFIYFRIYQFENIHHKLFPSILLALTAIIAINSLFKDRKLNGRLQFVNKIGQRSLEIYLIHPLMFVGLGLLANYLAVFKCNILLVLLVASLFSALCISYCMIITELLWRNRYVVLFLFGRQK